MAQWRLPVISGRGTSDLTISTGTAANVTVTNGAANTKGSWTQVVAATTDEWHGFYVQMTTTGVSATNTARLVDIGIGAAGSEVVVVADMSMGHYSVPHAVFIPLLIPKGVRVAVRSAGVIASDGKSVAIHGIAGVGACPPWIYRRCTTYGTDSANSRGTAVNLPATANTDGAWTQLVASTTYDHRAFMITVGLGRGGTTVTACNAAFRIGVGGSGSEVDLTNYAWQYVSGTSENYDPGRVPRWTAQQHSVPAGSRLSVAAKGNTASFAQWDVSIHAFD